MRLFVSWDCLYHETCSSIMRLLETMLELMEWREEYGIKDFKVYTQDLTLKTADNLLIDTQSDSCAELSFPV